MDNYDFGPAKTPHSTVSAILGDFIRNGDERVKRIKQTGGTYSYYLTKNESEIGIEILSEERINNCKSKFSVTRKLLVGFARS